MWLLTNGIDSSISLIHLPLSAAAKIYHLPALVLLISNWNKTALEFPLSLVYVNNMCSKEVPMRIKQVVTLQDLRSEETQAVSLATPTAIITLENKYQVHRT